MNDLAAATSAAQIFNAAVATWAISAAWETGALAELDSEGTIEIGEFAAARALDRVSADAMFRSLASVGIVEIEGTKVAQLDVFGEIMETKAFFHWLARGNAPLFQEMATVMSEDRRVGTFYSRNAPAISVACKEIDERTYAPAFRSVIESLDFEMSVIADLGCGSAERLMELLVRRPHASGIGIDIARDSLDDAQAEARRRGLDDRLEFVHADARDMPQLPRLREVDLLTCFMMGHDFWPREECVTSLRRLRACFPYVKRLLLGDATRTPSCDPRQLPVFTLGFEVAHDLMGTFIPTVDDWLGVFADGGWRLKEHYAIDALVGEQIFELEPLAD